MPGMKPEDVYELVWVSDVRVSPDGRTIAYVVSHIDKDENEYRADIWLGDSSGDGDARRLTFGPRSNSQPRWSPDGASLAFVSNRDKEKDSAQLYVIAPSGGEARRLTDFDEDVSDVVWSPDSKSLAFASRVRDEAYSESDPKRRRPRRINRLMFKLDNVGWTTDRRQHIFVVAADGSTPPIQLTSGDYEDTRPTWAPDGHRIAFASGRHDEWDIDPVSDIYTVPVSGGEPERVTGLDGSCDAPAWSPNRQRIAYLFFAGRWDYPRHTQVAVVDLATGSREVLTASLDRTCAPYPLIREPIWDGEDVVFSIEDAGNVHLYRVASDGSGKPEPIIEGERWLTSYDVAGGTIAYAATDTTTPSELYVGNERLTSVSDPFTSSRQPVAAERFTATSPDGSEVEAWIMKPTDFEPGRRYPALLNIHGGPFSQYGNKFFDEFQAYAGAGYAVVFSNPRGSSGYSEEWGRAIRGPANGQGPGTGTVDYDDVMAVVDAALERYDFLDPERLGVLGGSYGGYLTSWILSHNDRFAAACSERALNNWLSFYGSSDVGYIFKGEIGAWPFEDTDAYLKMSPTTYAADISTPLLIIHSENDLRCDIEQAEHLFTTLRLLRKEVELVRFPEEGHELSRSGSPAHRVMRLQIIVEWFDRHLKAT